MTTYRILFESEPFEAQSPEEAINLLNGGGVRIANRRLEYQLPSVWVPASEQPPVVAAPELAEVPAQLFLNPADLRLDLGVGYVRLTHLPTGVMVKGDNQAEVLDLLVKKLKREEMEPLREPAKVLPFSPKPGLHPSIRQAAPESKEE